MLTDSRPFGENINAALKAHVVSVDDWRYREVVQLLHEWTDRFDRELNLDIGTPVLAVERISSRALGTYRLGRNRSGLLHEITLNTLYLARPLADILRTLLHELIHEWQALSGKVSKGSYNYHNKQFRKKALSYGLLVDARGRSRGVEPGAFTTLLTKYGVDASYLRLLQVKHERTAIRTPGQSKLKKWSCGCTNVRAAVELNAWCLTCGKTFQRTSPSW